MAGLPDRPRPGLGCGVDPVVDVKAMTDEVNQMAATTDTSAVVSQEQTIQAPRVLLGPIRQVLGAGSGSIHLGHMWACFDSA